MRARHGTAVFEQEARTPPPEAYCLSLDGAEPAPRQLSAWSRSGRTLVPVSKCPRTYASMVYDPRRRAPEGYVDPVKVTTSKPRGVAEDIVEVSVMTEQGTGGVMSLCEVLREGGTWARVGCRVLYGWVS